MASFSPVSALLGGLLIGLAAALLMLLNGRISGISGILGDLLAPGANYRDWRIAFLSGLVAAPLLYALAGALTGRFAQPIPDMPGWTPVIVGGLLVGFGVRMAGGCTSGHGVCGMARLSQRSIVSTAIFMATAAAVVFAVRHGIGM
jgi:uncharacterized membrane protein YedE/YeeE